MPSVLKCVYFQEFGGGETPFNTVRTKFAIFEFYTV